MQMIPVHVSVTGNDTADALSKVSLYPVLLCAINYIRKSEIRNITIGLKY